MQKELNWIQVEAELFALLLFLCDGLFQIKNNNDNNNISLKDRELAKSC